MAAAQTFDASTSSDEALLIERVVRDGDEAAFEVLYDRYLPRVYRFVSRRVRNRADTEEIVQEVFINIFSSIGSFRGEAPFAAWVLGLTRRTIANRFKKKRHVTVPLAPDDEPETVDLTIPMLRREPTPLDHYECSERIAQLESAAAQELTPEQRQLFEMHHLDHRSIHEIAVALDRSEDAVKSNLYRARRLLLAR
jgi:RNA polymerase sigma-70 factor (ECF subfamily)